MKHSKLIIALLATLSATNLNAQDQKLPIDSSFRVGQLENGLTYYIKHNELPKDQAFFAIAQKVGSVQEEDNQQGLAHFLEHLAFNGLKHFPGDKMINYLEVNGIKFGAELNAYTSFDQTFYYFSGVPTNKSQGLIDSCLLILSDWSGNILLTDEEIDKERGVIKSEAIQSSSAQIRLIEKHGPELMSNSKYAYRLPIGKVEIIENFPYDVLRDYYRKWYHPSNQGIIIIGDIDVDYIENKIKENFAQFTNPENAAPVVYPSVDNNEQAIYVSGKDKEQAYSQIELFFKNEAFPFEMRGNISYYLNNMLMSLFSSMTNNRLAELTQKADAPYVELGGYSSSFFIAKTKEAFEIYSVAKEGQEYESFKSMYREAMRIQKYGFVASEFNRAVDAFLNNKEVAYSNRDKQQTMSFVNKCLSNFLNNEYLISTEQDYELSKQLIKMITLDMINQLASQYISATDHNLAVLAIAPEKDGYNYLTPEMMRKAVEEVRAENIEPFVDDVKEDPLISQLPKAGSFKLIKKEPLTNADIYELSNGVKVYALQTDYKKDEISMEALSWGGNSVYSDNDVYNVKYIKEIVPQLGLGDFNSTQLRKKLTGIHASLSFDIQDRTEAIYGNSTPKDIEYLFQMLYLYFTKPGSCKEDYDAFVEMAKTSLKNRNTIPYYTFNDSINKVLYDNNPRPADYQYEDFDKIDYKRIVEIFHERYNDVNNFTFFIIGNYDKTILENMLCKYLGALPKIKRNETYKPLVVNYHQGNASCDFNREMQTPQSMIYNAYYENSFDYDLRRELVSSMASQVLSDITFKEIREEAGITYGTQVDWNVNHADNSKTSSIFEFQCITKPEYGDVAQKMFDDILKRVTENGFEQEKLDKVKEYMIKAHKENLKENSYWRSIMRDKVFYGFDKHTNYDEYVNNITIADIQEYLKNIQKANGSVKIIMKPTGVEQEKELKKE
ncbi:MAG: insulinase family protein [Bacteroidales bacterium]|nr:insulinase family protein [Bacteroidales bacterium]